MKISNIITVDGDELWLIQQKIQEVIAEVFPEESARGMGLERYEGEVVTLERLTQSLQTPPLMWAPQKLIVLENAPFLENSDEAESWSNLFQHIAEGIRLLIVKNGKIDGRKKMGQWLTKNTAYFNFAKIPEWETDQFLIFIQNALRPYKYPKEFSAKLFEKVGPDLALLYSEIQKIKMFVGPEKPLELSLLNEIVSSGISKTFSLGEFLRRGDWSASLKTIHEMLEQEAPILVLGLLTAHFRLLLQVRSALNLRMPFEEMGKALQKNPFYLKRIAADMPASLNLPFLKAVHTSLAQLDVGYKNGTFSGKLPIFNTLSAIWK